MLFLHFYVLSTATAYNICQVSFQNLTHTFFYSTSQNLLVHVVSKSSKHLFKLHISSPIVVFVILRVCLPMKIRPLKNLSHKIFPHENFSIYGTSLFEIHFAINV